METRESFWEKDKYFEKIYNLYEDNLDELYIQAENSIVRKEYGRGGEVMHRGFYCPSPIQDIIIGNCNRGRLIKNPRKPPDYEYGFDQDGKLLSVKQFFNEIGNAYETELLFYEGDTVNSVSYQKEEWGNRIGWLTRCVYENGLIKTYDMASIFDPRESWEERREFQKQIRGLCHNVAKALSEESFRDYIENCENGQNDYTAKICSDMHTENFEYKDKILVSSTLEGYNFDLNILRQDEYFYEVDFDGKIISYAHKKE